MFTCLLICALGCESAHQHLKSINDLKDVDFGQSVPKHSLVLLHWFANAINIDNNHIVHLSFDPNREFGSHHYRNDEMVLNPLPSGYRYYTIGHLNYQFPGYVRHSPVREHQWYNVDRIIYRVQETSSGVHRVDQVYLTQHYRLHENRGTSYNPEHTYEISINLLLQIQMFSVQDNHRSLQELTYLFNSNANLTDIENIWGPSLASLGLLLFIVIQEKHIKIIRKAPKKSVSINLKDKHGFDTTVQAVPTLVNDCKDEPSNNTQTRNERRNKHPDFVVNIPDDECNTSLFNTNQSEQVNLKITTGKNGKAKVVWSNVSRQMINEGVAVIIFKHQWDQTLSSAYKLIQTSTGWYDSSVPLNEGLQARLHKAKKTCFFWTKVEEEICRGVAFKSPAKVSITGNNAYLQLFVNNGKACARLYVRKSFRQWKSEFAKSWVGFYKSAERETNDYEFWKWQWATKFQQGADDGDYNTLEYCSGLTVAPGVQARFIMKNYKEIACTPSWH